jgi:hypothetical protein
MDAERERVIAVLIIPCCEPHRRGSLTTWFLRFVQISLARIVLSVSHHVYHEKKLLTSPCCPNHKSVTSAIALHLQTVSNGNGR